MTARFSWRAMWPARLPLAALVLSLMTACGGGGGSGGSTTPPTISSPQFTLQPQSRTVMTGAAASFSATATGTSPLQLQWQRSSDGGSSWSDVTKADASTLTVDAATLADTAIRYRVAASNGGGTSYSDSAELTVKPTVQVYAGTLGGYGNAEGAGAEARFSDPRGVVGDAAGNLYVADTGNQVIRRITPDGRSSVFAGAPGQSGMVDGKGGIARFREPSQLALAPDGGLYVGDYSAIRKITPDGTVSTLAGGPSGQASVDGIGSAAGFVDIRAMVADTTGNIYVAAHNTIRKISPSGEVRTIAGAAAQSDRVDGVGSAARFLYPNALALNGQGLLFIGEERAVRVLDLATGQVSRYAGQYNYALYLVIEGDRYAGAVFHQITGLAFGQDRKLYVLQPSVVSSIDQAGQVRNYAGSTTPGNSSSDGTWSTARLSVTRNLMQLPGGDLVFTEGGFGHVVRRISADGQIRTVAGKLPEIARTDGSLAQARFRDPTRLLLAPDGSLLLADQGNNTIRRITSNGTVSTFAGSGAVGSANGNGVSASFSSPNDLAQDGQGNLFVADMDNQLIRKISPAGAVETRAGQALELGQTDGTVSQARFTLPRALAMDALGTLYVAEWNCTLRRITAAGIVTTLGSSSRCYDTNGPVGQASFGQIAALAFDSKGNLIMASQSTHTLRRLTPDGEVSTLIGLQGALGYSNAAMPDTRLNSPTCLAIDARDNIYFCDRGNHVIRRLGADGQVATVMGQPGVAAVKPGVDGSINAPRSIAIRPNGRLLVLTEQAIISD